MRIADTQTEHTTALAEHTAALSRIDDTLSEHTARFERIETSCRRCWTARHEQGR